MDLFSANIAYAASSAVNTFIGKVDDMIINPLIKFLFALAILYFLWGVLDFLLHSDNEEKKTAGKSHMIWGIVGITIMMGVFTIMHFILNTLHVNGVDPEQGTVQLQ